MAERILLLLSTHMISSSDFWNVRYRGSTVPFTQ